jgi:hypothetical protein
MRYKGRGKRLLIAYIGDYETCERWASASLYSCAPLGNGKQYFDVNIMALGLLRGW